MAATEVIQLHTTPELRARLESEAARLNLTLSAYILYLQTRLGDPPRVDRHVREVFGKHGDLMRRLAK